MKTSNIPAMQSIVRSAILALLLIQYHMIYTQEYIQIKGSIRTMEGIRQQALITLNDTENMVLATSTGKARFRFRIPLNSAYDLRVSQAGFMDKAVVIDTHHARSDKPSWRHNKNIRFDVEMMEQNDEQTLYHPGPVGTLSFIPGSGSLLVAYHASIAELDRSDLVVGR